MVFLAVQSIQGEEPDAVPADAGHEPLDGLHVAGNALRIPAEGDHVIELELAGGGELLPVLLYFGQFVGQLIRPDEAGGSKAKQER